MQESISDNLCTQKPYFKNLSRKDYVVKASQIIEQEGIGAISIRRLSREMGCSTTTMYRHFRNLDELLFYAVLGKLNTYIENLNRCVSGWKTIWDMHFCIWEQYAKQAFLRPEAFDLLFFNNIGTELGDALKEYYEMFPETIVDTPPIIQHMLELPGYYERDYCILQKLVDQQVMSRQTARKINHIECNLYLGYFKSVMHSHLSEEQKLRLVEQFLTEIRELIALYLEKDPVYREKHGENLPESPFESDAYNQII